MNLFVVITRSIQITLFGFTLNVLAVSWRLQRLGSWIWGRNYLSTEARSVAFR